MTSGLSQVMRAELLWLLKQPGGFPAKNRSDFELMELDIFCPEPGKVSLGLKIRAVCRGMGVAGRDCEFPSLQSFGVLRFSNIIVYYCLGMAWLFFLKVGSMIFHVLFEGPDRYAKGMQVHTSTNTQRSHALDIQLTITPTEMHRQRSDFTHVDHKKSFDGRNAAPVTRGYA